MSPLVTEAPVGFPTTVEGPRPLRPVRVAVVGLARAGILHTAVLSTIPDCEVVGVSDTRSAARRNLRGLGYAAAGFDRVEKLLAKTRPDAVIVCNRPEEHVETARAALQAGAAVLIERPFARSRAEGEPLVRLAAERGLPIASAHTLAYHPVFEAAGRALGDGVLGALRMARASLFVSWVFSARQQLDHAPAESGGGVAAQPASDLLAFLIGRLGFPAEVRATCNRIYGEAEDEMHAMLRLPGGMEVGFDTSWSVPGYPRPATVIELEGENGKLLAAEDALEFELHAPRAGFGAGVTRLGHGELPAAARFDLEGDAAYLQDAAFLQWVTGGEAIATRGERALEILAVLESLYASARQAGAPVPVAA